MSSPLPILDAPQVKGARDIHIRLRVELSIKTTTKIVIKNEIKVEK